MTSFPIIEGYPAVNLEVASSNSCQDIKKNHFATTAAEAAADIDDSIKRTRIRVSLDYILLPFAHLSTAREFERDFWTLRGL